MIVNMNEINDEILSYIIKIQYDHNIIFESKINFEGLNTILIPKKYYEELYYYYLIFGGVLN